MPTNRVRHCRIARPNTLLVVLLALGLVVATLPVAAQVTTGSGAEGAVQQTDAPAASAPVEAPLPPAPPEDAPTPTQIQALDQQMRAAYNRSDWAEVLRLIDAIRAIDPSYKADELREIEYQAHLAYGWDLLLAGRCLESIDQFRLALLIKPSDTQANQGLDAVARYCKTPVPTGTTTATATPGPTATWAPGTNTYVVREGDTLYSIARRFNTTVTALKQANGLSSDHIWIGQVLLIPGGPPPTAWATPSPTPTCTPGGPQPTPYPLQQPIRHVVQPGETLCALARHYGTTVWAIMAENHLYTTTIYAYSVLWIPVSSQAGPIRHLVQPGNTLFSLSRSYGVSIASIMAANNLHSTTIYVGQTLIIPSGEYGWYPGYPTSDPCSPPGGQRTHVIRAGETLSSIARLYGTTVHALQAANGLTSDRIYAGTVLYIP